MRIGIFTYGTRGDVQPYIALALGLINKGHEVILAAPENFKEFIEEFNISFHPLYGHVEFDEFRRRKKSSSVRKYYQINAILF